MKKGFSIFCVSVLVVSCKPDDPHDRPDDTLKDVWKQPRIVGPVFNADSAYAYTKAQIAFGPHVPGSAEHDKCAC